MGKEKQVIQRYCIEQKHTAGSVSLLIFSILSVSMITADAAQYDKTTLTIPLEYNYLPGEAYWSKFGSIDSRAFMLKTGELQDNILGEVTTSSGYTYSLVPRSSFDTYFSTAVHAILTKYGISLVYASPFVLHITPLYIKITAADNDTDGDKLCTVKLRVVLTGNTKKVLCEVIVENTGIDDFNADEKDEYADLLDRTIHGAIVKIWASRILFTDKVLGRGRIIKKEQGVYGFLPEDIPSNDIYTDTTADGAVSQAPRTPISTQLPSHSPSEEVSPQIITGTYSERDSVVLTQGKKIPIGILPFENATGSEKLSFITREVRELLQAQLAKSRTVKVMDREKLSDILREQALGLTGALNDSTVVMVGNISGLRAMVAGRLTTSGSYYRLNARIINVETSAIVTAVSVTIPDANAITSGVPELAAKLLYEFTEEKIEVNRNTMNYPTASPISTSAITASVEDAWAVTVNPAALMKVKKRDANFFISFGKKLTGKINSPTNTEVASRQPPFENMGVNVALPIRLRFASGFSITHQYSFPRLENTIGTNVYNIKEEETVFTIPLAFGVNPKLSFGVNLNTHIMEYQITNPGFVYRSGNVIFLDGKYAALFKVSERFRAGLTFQPESYYMKAREKTGTVDDYVSITRKTPAEFRFGTAMYPLTWLFFFTDLEYEKQPGNEKIQPGFYLGLQFTYTGKPLNIRFMPQYGMIPLYISYAHEPYNKNTGTQAKYVSLGTGYFLNNMYLRWSLRFNVEKEEERKIVVGLPDRSSVTLLDYRLSTPMFLCVGYRF